MHFLSKSFITHIPHSGNILFNESGTQILTGKVTNHSHLQEFPDLDVWPHQLPGDRRAQTFCSMPIYYDYPISSTQLAVHNCHWEMLLQSHQPEQLLPTQKCGNLVEIPILFWLCRSRFTVLLMPTTPWEMESPRFANQL